MFRSADRSRLDRVLAALEIPALALWVGALCGFAFIFAPAAFRLIPNVGQFAALTAANLHVLATLGYTCGAIAVIAAGLRARDAADRTNDIVRIALVLAALGLTAFENLVIVPAMTAMPDFTSPGYHDLHNESSLVYGGVVLADFAALVMAAIRHDG